jgi:hypothetical protein
MKELNFDGPLNSLSFGNVSLNILRELYKQGVKVNLFPTGNSIELSAFNNVDDDFVEWLKNSQRNALKNLNKNTPTLKVWHINGSERKIGDKQYLYTFYEVDSPTEEEINIVKSQEHVFFSSSESAKFFADKGCENVSYIPLGFDSDFHRTGKKYMDEDITHFGLIGKFEKRKNTAALINLWVRRFGDNPKYQLTCLIHNPFFEEKQLKSLIQESLGGRSWSNVNFLPRLKTNEEVNELMNAIDIDLSGLSNGEGWNLPAFNATSLGKWSIVTNCSSHKDWANEKNSVIVNPTGKQPCYDNMFFKEGLPFNQGQYSKIDINSVNDGIDRALKLSKTENKEGLKLQDEFLYSNTANKILNKIF